MSTTPLPPSEQAVLDALRAVHDPEIGLDVVELGLVYRVEVRDGGEVAIDLTMTSAACPLAEQVVADALGALRALPGVSRASVRLVYEPPWTPARMAPAARRALGWTA